MFRKLKWTVAILVIVLVVIAAGAVLYLRSAVQDYDAEVRAGVAAPVDIVRDSLGIPHIFAQSDEDALFAQGYAHAQDRLFQMELFRRLIEGRVAEVLGPDLVATDRFMRTVGLLRAGAASERTTSPETMRLIRAYCAGVNAAINGWQGALPPEFVVLKLQPEAWTPRLVLAIGKMMAYDLSEYASEINYTRSVQRLGPEKSRILEPFDFPWGDVILPDAAGAQPADRAGRSVASSLAVPNVSDMTRHLIESFSTLRASNSWVISGRFTASGKPILANDMHLGLRAPSIWYLAALHSPTLDVVGMTLPGAPGIVAGHSRSVAWGYTNAYVDDADLFIERLDPNDSTRYLVPGGSEPFTILAEKIAIKGRDAETLRIRLTRHGPIINDVERRLIGSRDLLALQWASALPSHAPEGLLAMNRARSAQEFLRAVEKFDDPHQNIVYADTAGNFGYVMGGRVAIRGNGRRPPALPVDGAKGEYDWTGQLPFAQHPQSLNPTRGYVVTANNRQMHGRVGDLVSSRWEEPFRAMRIRELIEQAVQKGEKLTAADVHRMQMDLRDIRAERYRDRAVQAAQRAGLQVEARRIHNWDLNATAESTDAPIYYVWYEELRKVLARSLYGTGGWFPEESIDRVLEERRVPWLPRPEAAFDSLTVDAMRTAAPVARGKRWGELNSVAIEHPLGSVPMLQKGLEFTLGPQPYGGSAVTVNVSHYGLNFPVRTYGGPSQRHVVDMGNIDGAGGFIIPTGQSGLPFAKHYRDQFDKWLRGGLNLVPLDSARSTRAVENRMRLEPQK